MIDPDWYRVFALGQKGTNNVLVYPNYKTVERLPYNLDSAVGIDFGYTNPSAAVRVYFGDGKIFVEQLIYESHLTTPEFAEKLLPLLRKDEVCWCDAAEPDRIQELKKLGVYAKASDKSVKAGIDSVKTYQLFISNTSIDVLREIKSYRWKKDAQDRMLEEPVKILDHSMDAMRYCVFNERKRPSGDWSYEFSIVPFS